MSAQDLIDCLGYLYLFIGSIRVYIYALLFIPIAYEESVEDLRNERKKF